MTSQKVLEGEVDPAARLEIVQLTAMSPEKAVFCGDCIKQLHFWCESGVPEGFEGTIPRPGVTMYVIGHEQIDAVIRVVVQGRRLRLLAAGLFSKDAVVLSAALSRI